MVRCPQCPVRPGAPCLGAESPTTHGHFCRWAESGTDQQRAHIVGRSAIAEADHAAFPQARPAPAPNIHLDRLMLVWGCDYRSDATDECGCTGRKHCALGRGKWTSEPHAVALDDCFACVGVTSLPSAPTAPGSTAD